MMLPEMFLYIVHFNFDCSNVSDERLQCFDAVNLVAGRVSGCKNWVVRYWCGYLSGVWCEWFAHGPADATAIPIVSCSS